MRVRRTVHRADRDGEAVDEFEAMPDSLAHTVFGALEQAYPFGTTFVLAIRRRNGDIITLEVVA